MRAARNIRRRLIGLLVACALVAVSVVAVPTAEAQSGYADRAPFGGVEGQIVTVLAVGDQVWAGGFFSLAYDPDHTTSYPRSDLAVFDFNTGDVLPIALDPNNIVTSLATDDERLVFVGGHFTEIGGETVTHIAAYDVFTGQLDTTFNVVLDNDVDALHYADGWLYIGGEFSQVNGLTFNRLVRVDPLTGQADTTFQPNPDATVNSIDSFGDRIYAAGYFENVGFEPNVLSRTWVAGFDVTTGLAAGPEFPFLPLGPNEQLHKAGLWFVHASYDGEAIYTGDRRNWIRKWDRLTGEMLWERRGDGDMQTAVTEGDLVYGGTHDGLLEKTDKRLLFTLDAATGAVNESFAPTVNTFIGVLALDLSQGALIAAGDFTEINDESSPRLAIFHGPDWTGATALEPPSGVLGDVGCDQQISIGDAVLIAQHITGLRTLSTCPLADPATQIGPGGDVNLDGQISIADAVIVAQCTAGLTNVLCP